MKVIIRDNAKDAALWVAHRIAGAINAKADIQRVTYPQHRNSDMRIGCLTPLVRQSRCFRPYDNSRGAHHIRLVVETRVLQLCRQNLDAILLQPFYTLFRRASHTWNTKEGTYRSTYQIGVVKVCQGVTHDDSIRIGSISRSEYRAHIAGFLDTFHHDDKCTFLQLQVFQRLLTNVHLSNHTFGTSAICHLIIYISSDLEQTGTFYLRFLRPEYLRTPEQSVNLVAAVDAALYLPTAFYDEKTMLSSHGRFLLQFQQ